MQLTKNFSFKELECSCGCGQCNMSPVLLKVLQGIRDEMRIPLQVSSGYRCKIHNHMIGGSEKSMHLEGRAVDIITTGFTPTEYALLLRAIFKRKNIKGIGFGKGFIHIDTRVIKEPIVAWRYT